MTAVYHPGANWSPRLNDTALVTHRAWFREMPYFPEPTAGVGTALPELTSL